MRIRFISKFDDFVALLEKTAAVILFVALMALMLLNIISRNLFDTSIPKIMEIVPALVVWLAFLGGTLAFRNQRHIRLELLLRFCPAGIKACAGVLSSLFGILVMTILFVASLEFLAHEVDFFGSRGWHAINFPIFFGICAFRYLVLMVEHVLRLWMGNGDAPEPEIK